MTAPALSLTEVTKNFGQTEIIRGVNLDVAAGERHAMIGPNGAGKTTLFNLISGRFADHLGRDPRSTASASTVCRRIEINRLGLSRSFQITSIFHRLACSRTCAAAAVEPRLPLLVLACRCGRQRA